MQPRSVLSAKLKKFCDNVYFQPPSNIHLKYPCIIYQLAGIDSMAANDSKYSTTGRYTITVIANDPDSRIAIDILLDLKHSKLINSFTFENLHHTMLEIFI